MLTPQNNITQRIIPTSEELKILREKMNNIKDLNLFKNSSMSLISNGTNSKINLNSVDQRDNKEVLIRTNSKYLSRDICLNNNSMSTNLNMNFKNTMIISDKDADVLNQRYVEVQKYLEVNKEKLEKIENYDLLMIENEELKNELNKNQILDNNMTFKDVLFDYIRMKSDFIVLTEQNRVQEKHILNLEKQIKLLLDVDSNTGVNKNYLKLFIITLINKKSLLDNKENFKIISDIFSSGSNLNTVSFLTERIDGLELQNFSLITKLEKITQSMTNNLNELIEYSEVISDIKNVINQVYDTQSLTTEFLIIRDTLNNRSSYLTTQKDTFYKEKDRIRNDAYKKANMDVLLCKDKIIESKVKLSYSGEKGEKGNTNKSLVHNNQNNKIFEVLDEKIEIYENLKNNLAQYEDFINKTSHDERDDNNTQLNIAENLMNENYILKNKHIKLQDFIMKLVKNKNFDVDSIDEDNFNILSDVLNIKKDVVYSEDMFHMIMAQACVIENMITSN